MRHSVIHHTGKGLGGICHAVRSAPRTNRCIHRALEHKGSIGFKLDAPKTVTEFIFLSRGMGHPLVRILSALQEGILPT